MAKLKCPKEDKKDWNIIKSIMGAAYANRATYMITNLEADKHVVYISNFDMVDFLLGVRDYDLTAHRVTLSDTYFDALNRHFPILFDKEWCVSIKPFLATLNANKTPHLMITNTTQSIAFTGTDGKTTMCATYAFRGPLRSFVDHFTNFEKLKETGITHNCKVDISHMSKAKVEYLPFDASEFKKAGKQLFKNKTLRVPMLEGVTNPSYSHYMKKITTPVETTYEFVAKVKGEVKYKAKYEDENMTIESIRPDVSLYIGLQ